MTTSDTGKTDLTNKAQAIPGMVSFPAAPEELEKSVEHSHLLQTLVENTPAAVAMFDREMRYLFWSRRWLTDYQLDQTPLRGRSHYEVFPEIPERWKAIHRRCLQGATERCDDDSFTREDGHTEYLRWEVKPWYEESGELGGIIMFTEVLTERRKAERTLIESQQTLRAIFDHTFQFIGMLDTHGVVLEANRTALESAGADADSVIGQLFWDTSWWAHSQELQVQLQDAVERCAAGEFVRMEVTHPGSDGEEHHVDFSLTPVYAPDGSVIRLIPEGRDITEFRRIERSLQKSELERQKLWAQMTQSHKMDGIGRLAAGIAHDFNNLLTVINGCSEMLIADEFPEEVRELAEEIRGAGERAARLTHQLLTFSRNQILKPQVLSLRTVTKSMADMLRRLIGENIRLDTRIPEDLWPVNIDAGQFEQVMVNLAVNARDAMPQGGTLGVELSNEQVDDLQPVFSTNLDPGRYVVISIRDTGEGMKADALKHVFEPFFTTKPRGKGSGLGLATVYGIVKQSKGYLDVRSEPGNGTTFTLYFPAVAEKAPHAESRKNQETDPVGGSETILLVEDEPSVRQLLSRRLSRLGYTVIPAVNGVDGIAVFRRHADQIDLVLTDVVMPAMGGGQMAAAIQKIRPDVKILFMSGYAEDTVVLHGIETGDVELLQKPFSKAELARQLRRMLQDQP